MAFTLAIFTDNRPQFIGLPLIIPDVSVHEEHVAESEITDNPIEGGGFVTDHIQDLPTVLSIEIGHSNAPANLLSDRNPIRHLTIWAKLEALKATQIPFIVVTSLKRYNNMIIQRMSLPRDKDSTTVSYISLTLRQVEFAFVDVASNVAPQAERALGFVELGSQGTQAI